MRMLGDDRTGSKSGKDAEVAEAQAQNCLQMHSPLESRAQTTRAIRSKATASNASHRMSNTRVSPISRGLHSQLQPQANMIG